MNKNTTPPIREFFIGIDVSKLHFDAALMISDYRRQGDIVTARFENNAAGLKAFDKWMKEYQVSRDENTLLVIENTGLYHRLIWNFCAKHGIRIHIGNGAEIKWSFGIARGKNDKVDSVRLCSYCFKNVDKLKVAPEPDLAILKLKDLISSRARLVDQRAANKKHLKELKATSDPAIYKVVEKAIKDAIAGLSKSIKSIEAEIKNVIATSETLDTNYKLLQSVPGIGPVIAAYLICCTFNFAANRTGKQLACYAGIAPFGIDSGTSVKRKPKVHKMGNKELKALLNQGARSAVQHNPEYKQYYDRKMKEGKDDLWVINAIKNKIVLRAVAVVRRGNPYVDKHRLAA